MVGIMRGMWFMLSSSSMMTPISGTDGSTSPVYDSLEISTTPCCIISPFLTSLANHHLAHQTGFLILDFYSPCYKTA